MMPGSLASGVWFLIALTGVSFSYPTQNDDWETNPHSPTSGVILIPDDPEFPEPPGSHSVSPLNFQPGRMSFAEKVYEHGSYNSESQGEGPPARQAEALDRFHGRRPLTALRPVGGVWFGYPPYYLLLPPTPGLRGWSSSPFLRG